MYTVVEKNIWSNVTNDTLNEVSKVMSDKLCDSPIGPKTRGHCIEMFKNKLSKRLLVGSIDYEVNSAIEYGVMYVTNVLEKNSRIY